MSNIRQYLRNRQNTGEKDEYDRRIALHRRKIRIGAVIALLAVVLAGIGIKIFLDNRSFDTYEVVNTTEMSSTGASKYYSFGNGMLIYSDDGISYIADGVTVWNQAFEMKKPIVDICTDVMAICDMETTSVYIYNTEGQMGTIETVYPIIAMEVSEQGIVAAITEDSETNRIEVFDREGNSIAIGRTYVTGEGCPVDISVSNDGTKLAAAYLYVDGGEAKSKVIFYNYSEVGKNEVGRIVGGFNHYEDTLISRVEFLDNNTVVVYGDNLFTVYSMKQKPEMIKEVESKQRIKSIFYNEKHIGMILESDDYNNPYIIKIYDTDGDEQLTMCTDFLYSGIEIKDDSLILYNDTDVMLMTTSGRERYRGTIDEGIVKVVPTLKSSKYYIVNSQYNIMEISLK